MSPDNGRVYLNMANRAAVGCYDAKNGTEQYSRAFIDGLGVLYASPVAANGRVYFSDREGAVAVLRAGDTFEVLAMNKLNDTFDASPAIVGDSIYLRGNKNLYCIAES